MRNTQLSQSIFIVTSKDNNSEPCASTRVITTKKRPTLRGVVGLTALTLGIGIVVGFDGVYAAPVHKTQFNSGARCIAQYNAKLMEAKSALIKGDRGRALDELVAARDQLGRCQEREEESATHATAVSLNLFDLSDSSGLV
jgi:hypothetical protein